MMKNRNVFLIVLGAALVVIAAVAGLVFGDVGTRTVEPVNVVSAPQDDSAWFGIKTVIVTPKKVVFEGTAKVPEVSQITATVLSENQENYLSNPDPQSGAWTMEFTRLPEYGTALRLSFSATVGDRTVSIDRQVDLTEEAAAEIPTGTNVLVIQWQDAPVAVTSTEVARLLGVPKSAVEAEVDYQRSDFYRIGTVTAGDHVGDPLLMVLAPCQGPCVNPVMMRMILDRKAGRLVNLSAYGLTRDEVFVNYDTWDEASGQEKTYFAPGKSVVDDSTLLLPVAEIPKHLQLSGSEYWLTSADSETFLADSTGLLDLGKTADGRTVYGSKEGGCIYVRSADAAYHLYDIEFPFRTENVLRIVWNDGTWNGSDYVFTDVGGCGASDCYAVRSESDLKPATRLTVIGKTSNGESIYGRKTQAEDIIDAKSSWSEIMGTEYTGGFESAGKHLVFYWKDPFGRWIRFVKTTALPPVECGKPVIYLYPEKDTAAHVSVGLKGEIAKSEPTHGATGWSVIAHPDGYVTDTKDGKTYPNLFWEGTGVGYETPKRGFVIRSSDRDGWLATTLAKIGFTARESAEFREFWVPRLPQTPYVFITFVDQKYFDRDAPLMISPKPDSVSRVFVEYRGLDAPIDVLPLPLPKIVRQGFTVVEWGGALK